MLFKKFILYSIIALLVSSCHSGSFLQRRYMPGIYVDNKTKGTTTTIQSHSNTMSDIPENIKTSRSHVVSKRNAELPILSGSIRNEKPVQDNKPANNKSHSSIGKVQRAESFSKTKPDNISKTFTPIKENPITHDVKTAHQPPDDQDERMLKDSRRTFVFGVLSLVSLALIIISYAILELLGVTGVEIGLLFLLFAFICIVCYVIFLIATIVCGSLAAKEAKNAGKKLSKRAIVGLIMACAPLVIALIVWMVAKLQNP
jgi:hypothetical protein